MYDSSNRTATGQILDFIHHREDGLLFGLNLILPVAELEEKKTHHNKKKKKITIIKFCCMILKSVYM